MTQRPADSPSLTDRTTSGFTWNFAQLLTGRAIYLGCHIALAWLLLPEAWGLIGLAYTITVFGEQFRALGVERVLVQRQVQLRRWENSAFWMCTAMGFLAMLLMIAVAKPAAMAYRVPELAWLIIALSLATPVRSFAMISIARLQIDLRFRFLALLEFLRGTSTILLTVLFAWLGFGVYSFIWPQVIVAVVHTTIVWSAAPPRVQRRVQLRRCRLLLGDSLAVFLAGLAHRLSVQGAVIMLGLFSQPEIVGIYYFSAGVAANAERLFVESLSSVLFPALSKIQNEMKRQAAAFLRASRLLAILVVPACLLQAGLADPIVRLFLEDKWLPTIPVIQILSVGAVFSSTSAPSQSVIQAQGRFRTYLVLVVAQTILILALLLAAALTGGAVAIAIAVAAAYSIIGPLRALVAIRPSRGTLREVVGIFAAPLFVSSVAVGAGVGLARLVPAGPAEPIVEAIVITVVTIAVYCWGIRLVSPADARDALDRVRALRRRRARPAVAESVGEPTDVGS